MLNFLFGSTKLRSKVWGGYSQPTPMIEGLPPKYEVEDNGFAQFVGSAKSYRYDAPLNAPIDPITNKPRSVYNPPAFDLDKKDHEVLEWVTKIHPSGVLVLIGLTLLVGLVLLSVVVLAFASTL